MQVLINKDPTRQIHCIDCEAKIELEEKILNLDSVLAENIFLCNKCSVEYVDGRINQAKKEIQTLLPIKGGLKQ